MANDKTVKPLGMHPYLRAKLAIDDLILAIVNLLTRSGDLKKLALVQLSTIIDQVPGVEKQFPWVASKDVQERAKPVFEALRAMLANEVGADLAELEGVAAKVKQAMAADIEKKVKAALADQAEPGMPESPTVDEGGPEGEDGEDDDGGETPPTVH